MEHYSSGRKRSRSKSNWLFGSGFPVLLGFMRVFRLREGTIFWRSLLQFSPKFSQNARRILKFNIWSITQVVVRGRTRNAIGRETGARVRLPDAPPNRMDRWILFVCPFFFAGTSPVHPVLWAYGIMLTHCHSIAKRTYKKLKHINNNSYNIDKTIWCGKVKVFWNLYLLQHSKLLKRTKPPLHKKRDGIQVLECRLH